MAVADKVQESIEDGAKAPEPAKGRIDQILDNLVASVLLIELVVMFGNVLMRTMTGQSFAWGQEVAEIALACLTFLGAAVAYRRGQHMAMHAVIQRLPESWHAPLAAAVDWVILVCSATALGLSFPMFKSHWGLTTPILQLRQSWLGLPLMLGLAMLCYYAIRRLWSAKGSQVAVSGAIVLGLAAVLFVSVTLLGAWSVGMTALFSALLFIALLCGGVPIGFILIMVSTAYLFLADAAPMPSIAIGLHGATGSFVLLAIPFFILAGNVMTEGGLSQPLAEAVGALFGHLRGGLLQVMIVSMYIFSGISGAKIADVAAVGSTMKKMLKEGGYDPAESTAVLASSAIMGETIPPSIAMLVLGSISSLSVGALFMAGLVPAAGLALILMVTAYLRARKAGMKPGKRPPIGQIVKLQLKAVPAFLVVVIMVVGILMGIATPTEISSVAVVYALVLAFGSRKLTLKTFWKTMSDTAGMSGMMLFMIASGSVFSLMLSMANLPNEIAALLASMGGSQYTFLIASILVLVVMGALLEGLPALLIFGPLLIPVAKQIGIDPLHMGIVLIVAMGLGAFSPPVGVGMYVTCSVCETTMEAATRKMIPYLIVLGLGLVAIAFVPWVSLGVPRLLHMSM